jgi:predicted DNA-binding WGR domain protein
MESQYNCTLYKLKDDEIGFYTIKILKTDDMYTLFTQYGKIGENGKVKEVKFSDFEGAKKSFEEVFYSKTDNKYGEQFNKQTDKYDIVFPNAQLTKTKEVSELLLSRPEMIYLFDLISNEKLIENALKKIQIDIARMPIAKMTKERIEKAEETLKKLKSMLFTKNDNDTLSCKEMQDLTSEYYIYMPFEVDSKNKNPPLLNTNQIIDLYMANMDIIKHIYVTYTSIIKNKRKNEVSNKYLHIYNNLGCDVEPLDKSTNIYSELLKYVANTHGPTHGRKLSVINIYTINNEKHNAIYEEYTKNIHNKTLLFHGSAVSNWFSILKNGLYLDSSKIGVKITGKMFGNGIYWANVVTKSFNYCNTGLSNGLAILGVGEVALGDMYVPTAADYSLTEKIVNGYKKHSTCGKGQNATSSVTTIDNINIPNGKLISTVGTCGLLYDEFVVYNVKQYTFRYLIVVQDNIK